MREQIVRGKGINEGEDFKGKNGVFILETQDAWHDCNDHHQILRIRVRPLHPRKYNG